MAVDNEFEIIQLMRLHLVRNGYQVVWTTESEKALDMIREESPDLILLDVVMPGVNGLELCSQIREITDVPVLFISCKSGELDKVMGLTVGGDDYITKPFSPMELAARVQAQLRRRALDKNAADPLGGEGTIKAVHPNSTDISASSMTADGTESMIPAKYPETDEYREDRKNSAHGSAVRDGIERGGLRIDVAAHTVEIDGTPILLTVKEFDLLSLLAGYPNRVFTPHQIFDSLWNTYGEEDDVRTVAVHISNLRKKLSAVSPDRKYIHTVRGVGYKFVPQSL